MTLPEEHLTEDMVVQAHFTQMRSTSRLCAHYLVLVDWLVSTVSHHTSTDDDDGGPHGQQLNWGEVKHVDEVSFDAPATRPAATTRWRDRHLFIRQQ